MICSLLIKHLLCTPLSWGSSRNITFYLNTCPLVTVMWLFAFLSATLALLSTFCLLLCLIDAVTVAVFGTLPENDKCYDLSAPISERGDTAVKLVLSKVISTGKSKAFNKTTYVKKLRCTWHRPPQKLRSEYFKFMIQMKMLNLTLGLFRSHGVHWRREQEGCRRARR